MKWKKGDIYEGEWKDYKANDLVVIKYNNGDMLEGEFKNGSWKS